MNVVKELIGEQNATLKVQLTPEDYQSRVSASLKDYKKKANVPGFRPGHIPDALIRKMYGKYALMDEVSKLVSETVSKYLSDEKLQILGDPMPLSDSDQMDWDNAVNYEFSFEIGLAPEFTLPLSKEDHLKVYEIQPNQEMEDAYVHNYTRRFGQFVSQESIVDGQEMLKGTFVELNDDKTPLEGGIRKEEASVYLEFLKGEEAKPLFLGKKAGEEVIVDLKQAFPNDVEISSMLGIDKQNVAQIKQWFSFKIGSVAKFVDAEVNQELFDKVYGEGVVTSEEDFRNRIKEEIKHHLAEDATYKFRVDTREALLQKVQLTLPDAFLKKWLLFSNKEKHTEESIEKEYPAFSRDLQWQLIVNQIIKDHNIEFTQENILDFAKETARHQFAQYGMLNVPEENLNSYAQTLLQNENEARHMFEQMYEDKALSIVKDEVSQDVTTISIDDYRAMIASSAS